MGGAVLSLSAPRHQLNDDVRFSRIERLSDRLDELASEVVHLRDHVSHDEPRVVVGRFE
jgi:hypothetical protein